MAENDSYRKHRLDAKDRSADDVQVDKHELEVNAQIHRRKDENTFPVRGEGRGVELWFSSRNDLFLRCAHMMLLSCQQIKCYLSQHPQPDLDDLRRKRNV